MITLFLGFVVFAAVLILVGILIWDRITINWVHNTCKWIIISLPLERIPSIPVGGSNLRISQLLTICGLYFLVILLVKKDVQTLKTKINFTLWLSLAFLSFGLFSLPFVKDLNRYLVTEIGTIICFLATVLISHFTIDVRARVKEFLASILVVCGFGIWQFVGDLAGLPTFLTGLREQYTKIVFGFPRIQSTAIEPLYFGGMLLVPIFLLLSRVLFQHQNKRTWTLLKLFFVLLVFVLTLSKGAWLAFGISFGLFLLFNLGNLLARFSKIKVSVVLQIAVAATIIMLGSYFLISPFRSGVNTTWEHLQATFDGSSTTIVERDKFVTDAFNLLQSNPVFGIGSGQYGTNFELGSDGGYLIVNNVYVETWLEHGLLAFLTFLLLLILPLYQLLKTKKVGHDWIATGLFFGLISYYCQWATFSPIFIMPIFILIGLTLSYAREHYELAK